MLTSFDCIRGIYVRGQNCNCRFDTRISACKYSFGIYQKLSRDKTIYIYIYWLTFLGEFSQCYIGDEYLNENYNRLFIIDIYFTIPCKLAVMPMCDCMNFAWVAWAVIVVNSKRFHLYFAVVVIVIYIRVNVLCNFPHWNIKGTMVTPGIVQNLFWTSNVINVK